MSLDRVTAADVGELRTFLTEADLTRAGLDAHQVRLFIQSGQLDREVAWSMAI
jgi:hypothetical protein